MTTSKDFASYCCDLLASAGPCVAKRMFGGFGISTEGLNIALLVDLGEGEKLWLKADNLSRSRYEAQGCAKFTYDTRRGPRSVDYYSAPEEAMDSPDGMRPWAALALECAVRARAGKASAKPRTAARKPATQSPAKVKASKPPQAKLKIARAATKALAKRAAPASTARSAAPKPQVAKPTPKRAAAPAPKAAAARKSAKGAKTAAQ